MVSHPHAVSPPTESLNPETLMPEITYSPHDKIAIVSLIIEMANADGNVDAHELLVANDIFCRLEIDETAFNIGKVIACTEALNIAGDWDRAKAVAVKDLLISVIEANRQVHPREFEVLKQYCSATGLTDLLD